jgi:hypothetical protein
MEELTNTCNSAIRNGADFPRIWHEILKVHPLVCGVPIQGILDMRPALEIPLLTGHRIVYDSEQCTFSLTFGKGPASAL